MTIPIPQTAAQRIYVGGPMTFHPWHNHPAFFAAAGALEDQGWVVVNPAALDIEAGYDPVRLYPDPTLHDWSVWPEDHLGHKRAVVRHDMELLLGCDAIYLLEGWQKSVGARAEHAVAVFGGLAIHFQTPPQSTKKDTNPKDAVGSNKLPFSTLSGPVLAEVGLGLLEGALKYGRHNYRVAGVRSSIYYDATLRHLIAWWEGEDIDPDCGLSHVTKAIASLFVLRDAQIQGTVEWDDRPPSSETFVPSLNGRAAQLIAEHPDPVPPYTLRPKGYTTTCSTP